MPCWKSGRRCGPWPVQPVQMPALVRRSAPARPQLWARFEEWAQVPPEALAQGRTRPAHPAHRPGGPRCPGSGGPGTILELPRAMFGALEQDTLRRWQQAAGARGFAGV